MDEPQEKDVLLSRALVVGINDNLLCGERLIGDFTLETENWTLRRFLFTDARAGRCQFTWNKLNPFIPNDILKKGDFREMGVYVASVRCEGKELLKD